MFSTSAYAGAREHAATIDRSDRGRLVVSGADRASYLQGLITNDVAVLKTGEGCYAAYLTPQGRMIADLFVYELGDVILVSVPLEQKDAVLARLDQFIFGEDVQLGDVTGSFFVVATVGPDAAGIVSGIVGCTVGEIDGLSEHANRRGGFEGGAAIVTRVTDTGEAGYDVYVEQEHSEALLRALADAGLPPADPETAETLRIEAGVPRFNRDMDEHTIPLEAGIEQRAISLTKGCYVGQEVIIRVLHRGHGRVARKLTGLVFDDGAAPASREAVTAAGREIGQITSSAISPALGRPVALAYLHRDFLAPGTPVLAGGRAGVVTALPFVRRSKA